MRICTAKASGISRETVKSRCAREWGGWGRISDDGPGQHNPDRSEGPWGRAARPARTEVFISASSLTQSRESRWQQRARRTKANQCAGKASSDSPALKPYRGKPAVRNFRGGDGNVGIIRSPVRAIALPDRAPAGGRANERRGLGNTCGRMSSALDETTKPLLVSVVNGGFSVKLGRFQGSLRKSNDIIAEPSCATARCR
jgi:hypothetical protein